MQYRFETTYDQTALSVMAKCIRKTARKSKSRRSHIFGWIVVVLALFLSFSSGEEGFSITFNKVITWIAALAIIAALIFEDQLNGYFSGKRFWSRWASPQQSPRWRMSRGWTFSTA